VPGLTPLTTAMARDIHVSSVEGGDVKYHFWNFDVHENN
jgi:hypothetical protein